MAHAIFFSLYKKRVKTTTTTYIPSSNNNNHTFPKVTLYFYSFHLCHNIKHFSSNTCFHVCFGLIYNKYRYVAVWIPYADGDKRSAQWCDSIAQAVSRADIVIECVPDDLKIKRAVLAQAAAT